MSSGLPFSCSSPPIADAWLIKALRLVYSKKPADHERLRQMYKDACENEAAISRMTINEAIREPKDTSRPQTPERESPATSSRIRPAPALTETSTCPPPVTPSTEITTTTTSITTSANLPSTSGSVPAQSASTSKGAKRSKVTFFNMFDPSSSSTVRPTTSFKSTPSTTVIDLTTSPSIQSPAKTTDAMASSSIISNPTIIDLTSSDSQASASVTSGDQEKVTSTADAHFVASLVADLTCCVCGKITPQPQLEPDGKTMNSNVLIECCQCGALYHQLCHQPPLISSYVVDPQQWSCSKCTSLAEGSTLPSDPAVILEEAPSDTTAAQISPAPTAGARKRKAGLTSAAIASSIRKT